MVQDLEPLTTPNSVLTYCLNGTTTTFNGNEFVLQNTMGNCKVERAKLSPGFIPMGMKEYGGIIYVTSYNPNTQECEIGSFPSPERDITGSTKIGNQTGLQDAFFETDDFSIPIERDGDGEFIPEAILSKIQKLNEESVLILNPGDKFITTYEFKEVTPSDPSTEIVTEENWNDYFNLDEQMDEDGNLVKKVFQLNFYKIDSSNNITKISGNEIKSIKYQEDIDEDEYIYYTQSNSGSIAVGVDMNSLSYFSASVREISKLKDVDKKFLIEAIGEADSSVNFKGVRVDVNKNNGEELLKFHLENNEIRDKISSVVDELQENDEVVCDITPYSDYGYLSDLMQSFNLKMGLAPTGQQVNNIFKWRVDEQNNRLELDFDFLLETDNTFRMYLEFYDTWSNVSTIRSIPTPSNYGPMRLVLNLKNESRNLTFDTYNPTVGLNTSQRGGVLFENLTVSQNEIAVPYLVNPDRNDGYQLIRSDNALRKNHFYIVRICGYEEFEENGEMKRIFHDAYKCLYTNAAYNDLYDAQLNIDQSSVFYYPDFTKVAYPIEKIKYLMDIEEAGSDTELTLIKTDVGTIPANIPTTKIDGVDYPFSLTSDPPEGVNELILNTKYEGTRNYNVRLSKPENLIYGDLKSNLLEIKTPAENRPVSSTSIEDTDLYQSDDMKMNTKAFIEIPDIDESSSIFSLKLNVETNRPIRGYIQRDVTGKIIEFKLGTHFFYHIYDTNSKYYGCSGNGYVSHMLYRLQASERNETCSDIASSRRIALAIRRTDDSENTSIYDISSAAGNNVNNDPITASMIRQSSSIGSNTNAFYSVLVGTYIEHVEHSPGLLFIDDVNQKTVFFPYAVSRPGTGITPPTLGTESSISTLKKALDTLFVQQYDGTAQVPTYYIREQIDAYQSPELTKLFNIFVNINSGWITPNVKTYIFNAHIHSLNTTNFTTSNINTLIAECKLRCFNHQVIEESNEISDSGIIPFLEENVTYPEEVTTFKLNDEQKRLASDEYVLNIMRTTKFQFDAYPRPSTTGGDSKVLSTNSAVGDPLNTFKDLFTYRPGTGSARGNLQLTGSLGVKQSYAVNRWGASTKVRSIDVSDIKFGGSSVVF